MKILRKYADSVEETVRNIPEDELDGKTDFGDGTEYFFLSKVFVNRNGDLLNVEEGEIFAAGETYPFDGEKWFKQAKEFMKKKFPHVQFSGSCCYELVGESMEVRFSFLFENKREARKHGDEIRSFASFMAIPWEADDFLSEPNLLREGSLGVVF